MHRDNARLQSTRSFLASSITLERRPQIKTQLIITRNSPTISQITLSSTISSRTTITTRHMRSRITSLMIINLPNRSRIANIRNQLRQHTQRSSPETPATRHLQPIRNSRRPSRHSNRRNPSRPRSLRRQQLNGLRPLTPRQNNNRNKTLQGQNQHCQRIVRSSAQTLKNMRTSSNPLISSHLVR